MPTSCAPRSANSRSCRVFAAQDDPRYGRMFPRSNDEMHDIRIRIRQEERRSRRERGFQSRFQIPPEKRTTSTRRRPESPRQCRRASENSDENSAESAERFVLRGNSCGARSRRTQEDRPRTICNMRRDSSSRSRGTGPGIQRMNRAGENGRKFGYQLGFGPNKAWGELPKSSGE